MILPFFNTKNKYNNSRHCFGWHRHTFSLQQFPTYFKSTIKIEMSLQHLRKKEKKCKIEIGYLLSIAMGREWVMYPLIAAHFGVVPSCWLYCWTSVGGFVFLVLAALSDSGVVMGLNFYINIRNKLLIMYQFFVMKIV